MCFWCSLHLAAALLLRDADLMVFWVLCRQSAANLAQQACRNHCTRNNPAAAAAAVQHLQFCSPVTGLWVQHPPHAQLQLTAASGGLDSSVTKLAPTWYCAPDTGEHSRWLRVSHELLALCILQCCSEGLLHVPVDCLSSRLQKLYGPNLGGS